MAGCDAGASDLKKAQIAATCDERPDVELVRAVEAEISLRHLLPQKSIDADHAGRAVTMPLRPVDNDEMIAHPIERAHVAPVSRVAGSGVTPASS